MADEKKALEKLGVLNQTPVADDGAQPQRFNQPSKNYGKNLGKFLHPKKGIPAEEANGTVDANTGGAKVRATQ
jgi:hypothetical protein